MHTSGPAPRRWLAPALVWAFVAFAALTMLPLPFGGDQALYAMFGWRVMGGAVLYRDVWDVKQPGIVWFHGVASALFGHNEVAGHLVEAVWWAGGGLLAVRAWRGRLSTRAAVVSLPLLVSGLQLASARAFDIGQVEHLVGVPMLASWWWLQPRAGASDAQRRGRIVAAGAAAAVVGLFKHLYLLVPLVFLALRLWRELRARRRFSRAVTAWYALGFGLVVLPFAAQVVVTHQVHRVWWTYVHAPGLMRSLDPPPFSRLVHSLAHAGTVYLPLVLLAAVGARRAWAPERRAGTVDMLGWVVAGAVAVSGQLWWSYQQLLVLVPLALLGSHGVDELATTGWRRAGTLARAGAVAAVLAGVVACRPLAQRTVALARHGGAFTVDDRRALRQDQEPAEAAAAASSTLLRAPGARPGPILVLGNPIHQLRTGRDQAGAIHGWSAEFMPPVLWREIAAALADPATAYLGVEDAHAGYLARTPEVRGVLATEYREVGRAGGVTWYEHVGPPGA